MIIIDRKWDGRLFRDLQIYISGLILQDIIFEYIRPGTHYKSVIRIAQNILHILDFI